MPISNPVGGSGGWTVESTNHTTTSATYASLKVFSGMTTTANTVYHIVAFFNVSAAQNVSFRIADQAGNELAVIGNVTANTGYPNVIEVWLCSDATNTTTSHAVVRESSDAAQTILTDNYAIGANWADVTSIDVRGQISGGATLTMLLCALEKIG